METILFMIIIGVLSTIFGKAKKKQGRSSKKPLLTNSMQEFRTMFKEINKPVQAGKVPNQTEIKMADKTASVLISEKKLETEYLQVRQESEVSRVGMSTIRQQAEKISAQTSRGEQEDDESMVSTHPDAKTLINGIVWAEILGEPRSKRPYLSRRG
ncbi:hypothetical protein [Neobacillus jeddahensis]|uniref:hypothetical protein n=1 Tax=Neobacillus jeddahensis TaxID=1461580 RepID=UPI00058DEA7D|nr:hypothetical protein [Neobacillus jeddahensis]